MTQLKYKGLGEEGDKHSHEINSSLIANLFSASDTISYYRKCYCVPSYGIGGPKYHYETSCDFTV